MPVYRDRRYSKRHSVYIPEFHLERRQRYNLIMTVEQLRNTISAQTFRPFTIHMGDGRRSLFSTGISSHIPLLAGR